MNDDELSFQQLCDWALKRPLPALAAPTGDWLNLGAGNSHILGSVSLDLPDWDGETDDIPAADNSIDHITAFHFLEHFTGAQAIRLLRECERVLRPGGFLTVAMPHWSSQLAHQDLDHKSFWTEETWKTLLKNIYYEKNQPRPWRLAVRFNLIAGVAHRNLMLFTQLEKTAR